MSYKDCLACEQAGTKPKKGAGKRVVFDPGMTMLGVPIIEGHRIGAGFMARRVYVLGFKDQMRDYNLSREELLVACWWAGIYGSRGMKKALGAWAKVAGQHLWYRCIQVPDPPMKESFVAVHSPVETKGS